MNYYNKLVKYSGYLASALFIAIGFIVSYEVIMRYLFNSPTIWVNEVSRFLQIWATYLALTYSFHKKDFIRITVIYDKLNESGKKILAYREKNYKIVVLKYLLLKDILKKFNLLKKKKVGGYFPINYEINCLEILKKLENSGCKISLPITRKGNKMDFFEWSSKHPFSISKIGIPEPFSKKKVYPDILLVPMLAFDKQKFRLGYGGGYYDRYIEKIKKIKKILTIGVAFSFQKTKKIPINSYDRKLDFILTEKYIN